MPIQGGGLSSEEELRAAVLELRQTVLPLKEMLGAPAREAIHEVAGNPARCQGLAGGKAGDAEGHGQGHYGQPAAGPRPRPEHFSRSLQTLKDRLKSLEMSHWVYEGILTEVWDPVWSPLLNVKKVKAKNQGNSSSGPSSPSQSRMHRPDRVRSPVTQMEGKSTPRGQKGSVTHPGQTVVWATQASHCCIQNGAGQDVLSEHAPE
ncbi:uncharacterized protein [Macaca nemestrina]|uniref:uncharacterized protein isoform X1 n=1 Tax=Macaca nemestrina TaxID=9545 RepID=UPI0039B8EB65